MPHNSRVPFTPVPNFCEENVWRHFQAPSGNPRWVVFVASTEGGCTMHAQISQTGGPEPVIWDYHVVALEQTPDGFTIWDPDCTEGYPLSRSRWTEANFPTPDPSVRFRVIEADAYLQNFKSDRRHMISGITPPWPKISQDENNLDEYKSVTPGPPGEVLDLGEWRKFGHPFNPSPLR